MASRVHHDFQAVGACAHAVACLVHKGRTHAVSDSQTKLVRRDVVPLGTQSPHWQPLVFKVTTEEAETRIAKFVTAPYPEELHRRWAERDLVPPLLEGPDGELPKRPGLLQLLWVQHLSREDGWQLLAEVPSVSEALGASMMAALSRLHEPVELDGKQMACVHGDLRAGNIFVR